jgi:hypothetical protein
MVRIKAAGGTAISQQSYSETAYYTYSPYYQNHLTRNACEPSPGCAEAV